MVSDNNDYCKSSSGTGGKMLNCFKKKGPWSYKTVKCANLDLFGEGIIPGQPIAGDWGGEYLCPSGEKYFIGDKYN